MAGATDIVICTPLRTPVGGFLGSLQTLTAADLGTQLLTALLERTGLQDGDVDDVVVGNANPSGEIPALGRILALNTGLDRAPGMQLDRRCGSGLQAVLTAAAQIASGGADLIVAGGAESMSQVEHYALLRQGVRADVQLADRLARARATAGGDRHPIPGGMIETAENLRRQYSISREAQDELAVRSHAMAAAAQSAGRYAEELVPVTVASRKGDVVVDTDEHIRPGTTMEVLAGLRPIMGRQDPDATVTAGNASGQNDAAALCVVTTRAHAETKGLTPLLALRSWAVAGVAPETMGIGPVPASAAALERAGLSMADLDLIELNEAFAAQALAVLTEWGMTDPGSWDRLNVNGSGISLGHPVGATGARILATMAYELQRREGRYALETMCIGGGQGLAAVFERVG
ncbi:acetyl-CoA C-acetyltransferase [Ornithinimicrobium tianjinense]|uniref:Probable acetyl-CoA acetyltransferase n=1 Tax=Ornithinimicrobium tianjinense TaxID=1195761 RepID=A0A917BKE1_9MICO|nr:acetyl-CoA C-acetyltransferase [Ornithinimicrobium tianjinense]GGF47453.1 acetyl-CoA acetyltransferase [Ornithinimicrobium tianjinense]